jgi:hypothetical protein
VVVIQDEHDLAVDGLELVQDSRDDRLEHEAARRTQRRLDRSTEVRHVPADRRDQVVPEDQRIVVTAIERDPGKRPVVEFLPLREQQCLAESRWSDDGNDGHPARRRGLRQPPPRHDPRAQAGRVQLAAEKCGAHGARAQLAWVDSASLARVDMRIVAAPEGERITPNG